MIPTVGRIVHYTNLGDKDGKYPPSVQAAIITKVTPIGTGGTPEENDFQCALHIFYVTGQFDRDDSKFSHAPAGSDEARGTWTWPAR